MSDLVELAETRREDLIRTVREAEREIKEIDTFLSLAGTLRRRLGVSAVARLSPPDFSDRVGQAALTVVKTEELLEKYNRPIHLAELYDLLTGMGVEIGGKEPKYNLSARLSNSGRFVSSRSEGWWFKDRPVPHRSAALADVVDDLNRGETVPERETAETGATESAVPQAVWEDADGTTTIISR